MKTKQKDDPAGKAPERSAERRDGAAVLRDGLDKWMRTHPVHVVVHVQGVEKPFTMSGSVVRVADKIDQIKQGTPAATFQLVGFGTDRNWAREQGEEV